MTKTKPMTDEWQTIFLNAGTEKGLGDLSMMIGVVSEIIAQATSKAREEERGRTIKIVKSERCNYKKDLPNLSRYGLGSREGGNHVVDSIIQSLKKDK